VAIVERMFDRCVSLRLRAPVCLFASCAHAPRRSCFADGQYQQAIGIALESRRLDKLEQAVLSSGDAPAHLAYSLRVTQTLVSSRDFRRKVRHRAGGGAAPARRARGGAELRATPHQTDSLV